MGVYNSSNQRVTRANVPVTPYVPSDPVFTVNERLTRKRVYPGQETIDHTEGLEEQILAEPGQKVRQSEIDAWFPAATVSSITPATGSTAGGTVVTIKGTNLDGVTGVTFGGTAGTSLTLVDSQTIRVTTPAKSAGAANVVVADDSGNVTQTGGFTYA